MSIVVRPVDLELDRKVLIDTLFHYLTPFSNGRRVDWLYQGNPHGKARAWFASDTGNREVVGVAAAFPRRIYVGENEMVSWVLGDFCISGHYRSLGPALQLQRTCLTEVDAGAVSFCYDFPSLSMLAVYQRLGVKPFRQMLRLAKLLRVDRKVREKIRVLPLARGLSIAGNVLLRLAHRRPESDGGLTVTLHAGQCGEEFSVLAREIGGRYGVCVQRSAAYLNWRYLANPLYHYEIVTARRDDVLVAYAVFTHAGDDAMLVDVFGIDDPGVVSSLLDAVTVLLRTRGVMTISAPMLESHPWVSLVQRLGFSAREATPVVLYPHPRSPTTNVPGDIGWFLMHGDRDI